MGRMDRIGLDHPDNRLRGGHLCNEADPGQQESEEEENCRECGNERRELLQQTELDTKDRFCERREQWRPEIAGSERWTQLRHVARFYHIHQGARRVCAQVRPGAEHVIEQDG